MGQGHTIHSVAPARVSWLIDKLEHHALSAAQLATLTHKKFLECLTELNEITEEFASYGGNKLVFCVKSGTDSSMLWKATVRVRCVKMQVDSDAIESSRILNLRQFIRLYNEILHQAQTCVKTESAMTASQILTRVDNFEDLEKPSIDECCICMDRKADHILPCTHSYCEKCIHEWNVSHSTCPVCRAETACDKDTWVLAERPEDDLEIHAELPARVLGLVDKAGRPIYSPPVEKAPKELDSPLYD